MGGDTGRLPKGSLKGRAESEDLIATASLEVSVNNINLSGRPVFYEVAYTRGGWIWRTAHRYRDWFSLKETLKSEYGARSLPDEEIFPGKENLGTVARKLLTTCEGCYDDSALVILEERRQGLETYFSKILAEKRELWDASVDIKNFFFPGPPTTYSAALARQRSERLKEEKLKAKKGAVSTSSRMASTIKSTFGTIFETKASSIPPSSPSRSWEDAEAQADDQSATPSVLNKITAKIPSLQGLLFDVPSPSLSLNSHSIRESETESVASLRNQRSNKAPSESGVTDQDGISDTGGSRHSIFG